MSYRHFQASDLLQITAALARGDDRAFDELYRLYSAALVLFAYQLTHDEAIAEDLVQEAYIKIWNRREKIEMVVNLKSYLYMIVKNACFDWLADRKKTRHDEIREQDQESRDADIEQWIIFTETMQEVQSAIERLPNRMKKVFSLYYLEGRSTREISRLMQTSERTVNHQRQTAMRQIRKTIIPGRNNDFEK